MPLRLPPLSPLRFFEAAGRLGSFKLAAEELHVTPSAVSHGIGALEQILGVELFRREPRGLSLTPAGADYLPYVAEAFSLIAIGTQRLPAPGGNRKIAISCAPTLASRWLLPRLQDFRSRWPDVDVIIDTSRRQVGFPVDGFDFALRLSRTSAAGQAWTRLFGERLVPVCSPAYRDAMADAQGHVDLGRATLIHVNSASEDWQAWLEKVGMESVDACAGLGFDTIQLAFEAAIAGLGVVLGRRPLVDNELASQALIEIGLPTYCGQAAYWLVSSASVDSRPDLLDFRQWLLTEIGAYAQAAPPDTEPPDPRITASQPA